jgi:hypothetical protein
LTACLAVTIRIRDFWDSPVNNFPMPSSSDLPATRPQ